MFFGLSFPFSAFSPLPSYFGVCACDGEVQSITIKSNQVLGIYFMNCHIEDLDEDIYPTYPQEVFTTYPAGALPKHFPKPLFLPPLKTN